MAGDSYPPTDADVSNQPGMAHTADASLMEPPEVCYLLHGKQSQPVIRSPGPAAALAIPAQFQTAWSATARGIPARVLSGSRVVDFAGELRQHGDASSTNSVPRGRPAASSPRRRSGKQKVELGVNRPCRGATGLRNEETEEVSQLWCGQALWQAQLLRLRRRTKAPKPVNLGWSPHPELNRRPRSYQERALPTELCGPGAKPRSVKRRGGAWARRRGLAAPPRRGHPAIRWATRRSRCRLRRSGTWRAGCP